MRQLLILFIVLLFNKGILKAQGPFYFTGTVKEKISSSVREGDIVQFIKFTRDDIGQTYAELICEDGKKELILIDRLNRIDFETDNLKDFWKSQALVNDVYSNILTNGFQYKLRKELEEETLEYINYFKSNNLIFNDSYLESYLYAIAYKIYPRTIKDGRPGILNVKVIKSEAPNAFIYSNGTMYISTGLLSTIDSEDELIAVMAHEISHFVLDHHVQNINAATKRAKRAAFWAGVATGVAAIADAYIASNNQYYDAGTITMGTAVLAFGVATAINERLGVNYSKEQEMKADKCASELLKYIGVDTTALSSALLKIKEFSILNGNYLAISGKGTHPAIDDRVKAMGKPSEKFENPDYDKLISFVNSFNAKIQINNHNLQACSDLVNRNIKAGVATEDDYILLAMVTTFMYDNKMKNNEALSYIEKAKSLNVVPTINIHKQEAIILIRLNEYDKAKEVLKKYLSAIETELSNSETITNSLAFANTNNFLVNEIKWTRKMIYKVGKM